MEAAFVPPDADLRALLGRTRTIAVVGLSENPFRPSYGVASYLVEAGYTVVPVNPMLKEWRGHEAYPDLASVKAAGIDVDLVDVFRAPEHVGPIVEEAIRMGAKAVWLQEGVVHLEAARAARRAGLEVVMDRCAMKEHARLVY